MNAQNRPMPATGEYRRRLIAAGQWPTDAVPGASRALTEAEAALLAQLQRRPHALNKRERDQLIKLERKAAAEAAALAVPSQQCLAVPGLAMHCPATLGLAEPRLALRRPVGLRRDKLAP
jgi:hypothetical protein